MAALVRLIAMQIGLDIHPILKKIGCVFAAAGDKFQVISGAVPENRFSPMIFWSVTV